MIYQKLGQTSAPLIYLWNKHMTIYQGAKELLQDD